MGQQNRELYAFNEFRVDAEKRVAYRDNGEQLPLKAKAFDTLLYLVENPGRVIERDELVSAIWADTVVEENNLTQHISAIRRSLGEKPDDHRYIVTVPGRGYKFVPPITVLEPDADGGNEIQQIDRVSETGDRHAARARPRFVPLVIAGLAIAALVSIGLLIWYQRQTPAADTSIDSLAVLPFKPLVLDQRDESLELGMADSLITKLSVSDIRVRPLAAVRRYNAVDLDPLAAGRELGVEAVLDGSIQIANDRVRISATLIRVSDGRQLWADQYSGAAGDIFALQDSISQRVASALTIVLGERSRKNYTASVDAYQMFARGKLHASRLIRPEVMKGIEYYEKAIAIDPNYAMAYVEVANACRALVLTSDARPSELMPKARAAAERAIEIDPTLAEAQGARATTAFWYDFDPGRAEQLYRQAIELDPQSMQARFGYAHLLSNTGRHDEALAEIKRARELDPANLMTNALEGQILAFAGRDDEALKVLQSTAEMDARFWLPHLFMTRVFIKREMWDESLAAATKARELSGGNAEAIATMAFVHAKAGRQAEADRILAELDEKARSQYVPSYGVAAVHYARGDRTKALDLLERSLADRDALMVFLKVDIKWEGLRNEPRFESLMKKMNLGRSVTSRKPCRFRSFCSAEVPGRAVLRAKGACVLGGQECPRPGELAGSFFDYFISS